LWRFIFHEKKHLPFGLSLRNVWVSQHPHQLRTCQRTLRDYAAGFGQKEKEKEGEAKLNEEGRKKNLPAMWRLWQ
jgi:hypothetical protein